MIEEGITLGFQEMEVRNYTYDLEGEDQVAIHGSNKTQNFMINVEQIYFDTNNDYQ